MKIKGKDEFLRQIEALPKAMRAEITKALDVSAEETTDVMKRFAPVESGRLKASIGYTFGEAPKGALNTSGKNARAAKAETDLSVTMFAGGGGAWYVRLVEFGTHAHVIVPKKAKVLSDGKHFYGTKVVHPGATAQPFFFPGYRFGRKRAKSRLSRAIRNGARKAFK